MAGIAKLGGTALDPDERKSIFASELLNELLVSGGDSRLTLTGASHENAYGCRAFPNPSLVDFASSTASSISPEAYEYASTRYEELQRAQEGVAVAAWSPHAEEVCESAVNAARLALLRNLGLEQSGAAVVFSASGTDAQLQILFLLKALAEGSLATVVVGADQTGSGTAYTSRGCHFGQITSLGFKVVKGEVVPGLGGIDSFTIPFARSGRGFHSMQEMDAGVLEAVGQALSTNDRVLLQTIESSKFGWKAPSDECLEELANRWPGKVQVVADACQLRTDTVRLSALLARGACVLVTGSKFFTGPAFSGALLVPKTLSARLSGIEVCATGFPAYSNRFDWPQQWEGIRRQYPIQFNTGQWLRWEAAIEEMRRYGSVPSFFRERVTEVFRGELEAQIAGTSNLRILHAPAGVGAQKPTIFPVFPMDGESILSIDLCGQIYKAMRRPFKPDAPEDSEAMATSCQVGQPVPLVGGGAALRFSLSARIVRDCWATSPCKADQNIARLRNNLALAVRKLSCLATMLPAQKISS